MKLKQHTRLSILVIVVAALLLEANTALEFFSTRRSFTEQLTEKAQRDLNESHRIGKVKQEVEQAVASVLPALSAATDKCDMDTLRVLLRQLTISQEQIVGVAIGFVPGFVHGLASDESSLGLALYEEDGQLREQSLSKDYIERPWYVQAMNSGDSWTEPYEGWFSYILMSSYSKVVHDSKGRTVAVVSADVPLRELSAMAAQFYENQQRAVLRNVLLHLLGLLLLGFIVWRTVGHIWRLQRVSAEKERIASELRVAHDIQQSMIPKTFPGFPERDDVELFASLTAAREVGGDFYDFLIRDEHLYFCIGDVTGKGVPAALLMTVMRSLFRVLSEESRVKSEEFAAAAIVQQLNKAMCEEQSEGYFVTMFVGILDLRTGLLDYCNAGHEKPILTTALDSKRNLPVGALADWHYQGQQVQLTAGDMLFLYTDGLSEARDSHDRPLSRSRVLSLACQFAASTTPRSLVTLMEQAAHDHADSAEQSDDITLMAVRWQGCNHFTLRADGKDLALLEGFVNQMAQRARLAELEVPRLRLAVEEAVTNVISYAHATYIQLTSEVRDGEMLLNVSDDGDPFDPTTAPMADTSVRADERPEGGLGILFIRRMSDALEYRREDGRNILTIKKIVKSEGVNEVSEVIASLEVNDNSNEH